MYQPLAGFLFSLVTVTLWALLPIALQGLLAEMNAETIVFFRFFTASIALFFILLFSKKLPNLRRLSKKDWFILIMGVLALAANFYLFNYALNFIPAETSQVINPLNSFFMIFAGVVIFHETVKRSNIVGLIIVIIGLALFFNQRYEAFLSYNEYSFGIFIALFAAMIWVIYAMAQKVLLKVIKSQQILLLVYTGCFICYLPIADFNQLNELTTYGIWALVFCCLNTIFAYGAYGEAIARWEVAKVSTVLTLLPIATIIFAHIAALIYPDKFKTPDLNFLAYLGACLVVVGAFLSALGEYLAKRYRNKRS
ncbi:DMT family transporter [Taylorella equigenitalis]|uniref:DMT family transporter n=1 Tax=Taylorella equigenitalis TaxID=29575 RepID=UPI00040F62D2|nr:DMT family transporter [Taylorella equigenitalis]WDU52729.1 DMT family transporter [Taylorella equigenitalis]